MEVIRAALRHGLHHQRTAASIFRGIVVDSHMQFLNRLRIGNEVVCAGIRIAGGKSVIQIKHVSFTSLPVRVDLGIVDQREDVCTVGIPLRIPSASDARGEANQVTYIPSWQG